MLKKSIAFSQGLLTMLGAMVFIFVTFHLVLYNKSTMEEMRFSGTTPKLRVKLKISLNNLFFYYYYQQLFLNKL